LRAETGLPVVTLTYNMLQDLAKELERGPVDFASGSFQLDSEGRLRWIWKLNGQELHPLVALLLGEFLPAEQRSGFSVNSKSLAKESERQDLFQACRVEFATWTLGGMMGLAPSALPFSHNEMDVLSRLAPGTRFGGLCFRKEEGVFFFEMTDKKSFRVQDSEELNPTYLASWELYWMLWHHMPSLVRLEACEAPEAKELAYLKPEERKFVSLARKVFGESGLPPHTPVEGDWSFAQPLILFPGKAGFLLEETLLLDDDEKLPEHFPNGTPVVVVDCRQSEEALVAVLQMHAKVKGA
jgi:hypothetical protein